jgi:hypothetical protein
MASGTAKHRIGIVAIILFIVFALIADLIGLIPFAKDFTGTIFWGITSFILWKKGLGIFNGKRLATMATSWLAGAIPVIQEFPIEITVGIVAIIIMSYAEEKTGLSLMKPGYAGKKIPGAREVLNSGGRREPQSGAGHIAPPPLNGEGMRLPG